jgi:hypothetical protein
MNGIKKTEISSKAKPKFTKEIPRFSRANDPTDKKPGDFLNINMSYCFEVIISWEPY